jgi:hypothetical protein
VDPHEGVLGQVLGGLVRSGQQVREAHLGVGALVEPGERRRLSNLLLVERQRELPHA